MLIAGLAVRLLALASPPAFSEDVFCYVYEGRLVWYRGPTFPFVHAPAMGPELGVPATLLDASWLRINHAHIPTIYPPLSQLFFAVAGGVGELFGGGHLTILKTTLVGAQAAAVAVLVSIARDPARRSTILTTLWLCPVATFEIAREGHADSVAVLGLALGVAGFAKARPTQGYTGWALAALGKLNGLAVLPAAARVNRRGLWIAAAIVPLVALPMVLGGLGASQGLTEYATRWRAGDGSFSLILSGWEVALGGSWSRWGSVTVTAHQLARLTTAGLFVAGMSALLWRPYPTEDIPERAGWIVLLLLLMSPTLHPWYSLWLLPFVPFARGARPAMFALLGLVWLNHHGGWLELEEGQWRELPWLRAVVHVPVWILALRGLRRGDAADDAP